MGGTGYSTRKCLTTSCCCVSSTCSVTYPIYLPPFLGALYLSSDELKELECQLIRRTEDPLQMDPGNSSIIAARAIAKFPGNVLDLSANLHGTFQAIDCKWLVTGDSDSPWSPPTYPTIVNSSDIQYIDPSTWYAIPIQKVHRVNTGIDLKYKDVITIKNVSCCIRFKPTHSNYWHFTLNFFTEDGEIDDLVRAGIVTRSASEKCGGRLRDWLRGIIGSNPQPALVNNQIPNTWCQHSQANACEHTP